MNWSWILHRASDALGLALIIRLLVLRLQSVYRVFCLFLVWDLVQSVVAAALASHPDVYRVVWIGLRVVAWVLSLWTVYALLDAVLAKYPGVLRFSKVLLNSSLSIALLIALGTARAEYDASSLASFPKPIDRAIGVTLVLERAISMAAVLVLIVILGFILWFPVQMPKNLAVFSVGFVVYFSLITALLLVQNLWSHGISQTISDLITLAPSGCYIYWLTFLSTQGESEPVRMGHSWQTSDQERLIGRLEAMNSALLRAARSK